MARLPRLEVPGLPHLVLLRGHNGQAVTVDAADRAAFRTALAAAASVSGVGVHAYSIGAQRIVLLATPHSAGAIGRLVQRVGRGYTAGYNRRHGRTGTLWDGRFRAAPIDPDTLFVAAMRLVEAPALADPAGTLSSVPHHCGGGPPDPLLSDHPAFWAIGNTPFEREAAYALLLAQPLDEETGQRLEHAMVRGWAAGTDRFVDELSRHVERRVRPLPAGRPRRRASATSRAN